MPDELSPTGRLRAELFAPVTAEATGTKATMRIFGRIDPDGQPFGVSSNDVQAALDTLPDNVTDLEVQVQTRGGDAFEGVAIMNMIRSLAINTEAVIVGLAASAGSYIVQGADKVTMMPHSQLMIHRGSVLALGQAPDMRMAADRLESLDKTMANIYTEKAGGAADEWLAAMTPETWYTADEAVAAGLADTVREMPKPSGAKASLDLSAFAYAGREHAPEPYMPTTIQTPAKPPEAPPANPEGADPMSDTIIAGLRERFGLADDADEAAIQAALDAQAAEVEQLKADARPKPNPRETADALPDGHVAIPQAALEELRIAAQAGQEARAEQLRASRDEAINAAVREGRIAPARAEHWRTQWDADAEGTRTVLAALEPVHPVGPLPGVPGGENSVSTEAWNDDDADALGAMVGLPKGALR